ncbi:MAG: magnesium transporter [Clostridiales bacterium GWB2_37_7]|nr:MAG: magnesium transporter [Clostridiales bacterium GWB2_37_7]
MNELILELINQNKLTEARHELEDMNIVDIAQLFEEIDRHQLIKFFRILPKDIAADVFSYIPTELQAFIIESITDFEIKHIIDDLFFDDTVDLIEEMPAVVVKKVLKSTDEQMRKLINQFLNYPEDSAGSVMTIEFVDLKKEMTVKHALSHIRKTGIDKETINTCYVIDANRKLEGIVSIRRLILSNSDELVEDIMNTDIIYIHTYDDQEKIAMLFKKYDLLSMPVVDNEIRLVGIITVDDVVDIIDQENTEDIHKMAAMAPSEEEYLKTSVLTLAKNRIVWLLVLMISATITGNIISKFQNVLETVVILATYVPMLMNTGGNAGSQSSTMAIRGLALGEIAPRDFLMIVWKEFRVSILVGFVLASVNFLRILMFDKVSINIGIVVSASLFFTVAMAKVVGGLLPLMAQKLKLDPAIMASPLITTIVDAVSLTIYFTMSTMLLGL